MAMKKNQTSANHTRRTFLKSAAATMILSGCGLGPHQPDAIPSVTDKQRKWRRQGESTVALLPCKSYEESLFKFLKEIAGKIQLPNLSGKVVVIKPNMVELRPGKPVTTHPAVLKASVELADHLGAKKIIVAEGPGHFRDTEYLLAASGIGPICSQLGLPFVDLNLDEIEKVDNSDGLTRLKPIFLPRTILEADAIISVPKLKTHHWVGMTASMKNFFGAVPGRKYGWPKNILHWAGIPASIIDLVHLLRPTFAVVDAIVAMEGDGPINGTSVDSNFIAVGTDLAAVDATCARAIDIEPSNLAYLKLAGQVIGNIEKEDIKVVGASLQSLLKKFQMPVTFPRLDDATQAKQHGS